MFSDEEMLNISHLWELKMSQLVGDLQQGFVAILFFF